MTRRNQVPYLGWNPNDLLNSSQAAGGAQQSADAANSAALSAQQAADAAQLDADAAQLAATNALARGNHTGTQTSSTISDFNSTTRSQMNSALVAGPGVTITSSGSGASRQLTVGVSGVLRPLVFITQADYTALPSIDPLVQYVLIPT